MAITAGFTQTESLPMTLTQNDILHHLVTLRYSTRKMIQAREINQSSIDILKSAHQHREIESNPVI